MEALSAPTSSLYIGLHGLFAVFLANFVLYIRLRSDKVPDWQPDSVLRVQANFVENVPLALLLLFFNRRSGAPSEFIHLFGSALFLSRIMHAYGLGRIEGANYPRLIGAQGTFLIISILSFVCVAIFFGFI